jgi:hypothetical protein
MRTAKFVMEIKVKDPDSKGKVEISIYKHENGGMFGIDSSFLEQFDEDSICVFNPFADVEGVEEHQVIAIKLDN